MPFKCFATQYLRPHGSKVQVHTTLPDEFEESYIEMKNCGCSIEMEVLNTGQVSITIFDGKEDIDIKIVENGPAVIKAVRDLLTNKLWRKETHE